jgi:NADPH:quinone reductase-like Zn-dependent oxidoreductase
LAFGVKAIVYSVTGSSGVLRVTGRPVPEPGEGEVRVRIVVSGVNPTDWKAHCGRAPGDALPFPEVVPDQDGSGVIDAAGPGLPLLRFPLERTADAHDAVEHGAVGKVLVDVAAG